MVRSGDGYHRLLLSNVEPGTRYCYRLSCDKTRSDPASRLQPEGVHGPSEVVDPSFPWTDDAWVNPALADYVFYELHAGSFSAEGSLTAVIPRLPYLKELGVTAIELMPVAQFPGRWNWGYDGVYPFAVQNTYGGPRALKQLVNAAHAEGLAVVLDVVYNHLGPEGNYLRDFGPYFTWRSKTPWGDALNFDGPDSDEVRRFFIQNALYWTGECHVDGLRLDAIHAIVDSSARPFVQELSDTIHDFGRRAGRRIHVIAESDLNDVRVVRPQSAGGLGCDAVWSDDFHHSLHAILTGERRGYYQDFGTLDQMAAAYTSGFVYSGQYSQFRRRRHGNPADDGTPGEHFVVCAQNHDQVGNRAQGERLSTLVDFESLKLAAGAVLLSPYLPLLFMGEEYGETAPFPYFTSYGDRDLIEGVRRGRKEEFAEFSWQGSLPDPQDEDTFRGSRLAPPERQTGRQRVLLEFYRELLRLRREVPALADLSMDRCEACPLEGQALLVRRRSGSSEVAMVLHFSERTGFLRIAFPQGNWTKLLCSADACWGGEFAAPATVSVHSGDLQIALSPRSILLYERS